MTLAFWSTAALLIAGALLFVLPPLLKPQRVRTAASPLDVYRDMRAQLAAERSAGKLSDVEHALAVAELEDRVLEEVVDAPAEREAASAHRPVAVILALALLVPGGALALYAVLGKPAALAPQAQQQAAAPHALTRDEMEERVAQLAERLRANPDDGDGWHMLARSYVAFDRIAEAAQAFDKARLLKPGDAQVLADYADTLAMLNGRNLEGRPMELVGEALAADPKHPKALMLAGTAYFNRSDFALAAVTWQKLLATLPPDSEQARSVAASISQAQAKAATPPANRPAAAPGAEAIEGTVAIADTLKARVPPRGTLFVFARAVNGPRMPLAIVRVPAGEFPFRFRLDDASAMTPQLRLSGQTEVMLAARLSPSGGATPQSGDLMVSLGPVKVGTKDVRLVIDGVVP